jgi:dolichol-phosphate mannosyltransferase
MRNRLIIVPTFNELVSAPLLVRRIFKYLPESNILVVDDGSPDKTADAIRELQQEFPTLHLLERKTKLGLGSAYRLGFTWGLDQGYEELIENWSRGRELLSRAANLYVRAMLGLGVRDSTAGFRIYSSSILKKLNLEAIKSEGYSFQIEMTRAVYKLGGKIIEVPITFRERENGVSKMSKKIVGEAIILVTLWGLKRFLRVK